MIGWKRPRAFKLSLQPRGHSCGLEKFSFGVCRTDASPKSQIFQFPLWSQVWHVPGAPSSRMLLALMSRWSTFMSWSFCSPSATC